MYILTKNLALNLGLQENLNLKLVYQDRCMAEAEDSDFDNDEEEERIYYAVDSGDECILKHLLDDGYNPNFKFEGMMYICIIIIIIVQTFKTKFQSNCRFLSLILLY